VVWNFGWLHQVAADAVSNCIFLALLKRLQPRLEWLEAASKWDLRTVIEIPVRPFADTQRHSLMHDIVLIKLGLDIETGCLECNSYPGDNVISCACSAASATTHLPRMWSRNEPNLAPLQWNKIRV
jgi:hypothetical protein